MPEPTPAALAANDPLYWTLLNKIQLGAGPFTMTGHAYQMEPMQDFARCQCAMKATQGGWTQQEVLRVLHALIYGRYPQGALYLFPTEDDVSEFSKARFGPLIADNPASIGRFVKSGGKGTDTTNLKKVGNAFLYLRGTRLTQSIGGGLGGKESPKMRSISVDCVVFDEVDLMDESVIAKAIARMGASTVQEERYVSNPTLPNFGIHKLFLESDQRYLFRKCPCGGWTCAELTFPACVKERDGRGYVACEKCGKPVGIEKVEWVPQAPSQSSVMHGYQWSQLSSTFHDPADILRAYNDPPQGNLADVCRLKLGQPYVAKEDQLRPDQVYACCGPDGMLDRSSIPCAMGVDIGREFHVVIGYKTGKERYEIIRLARIPCAASRVTMESAWGAVHDLARRFNIVSAVVDIRPYEHEARKFRKAEPYRVLLCEYTENALTGNKVDAAGEVVKAYRTGLLDTTHGLVVDGRVVLPRRCPEVDAFASQACATAKVLETNEKTGVKVYRYVKLGEDHYRHALGYFWLAARRLGVTVAGRRRNEQAVAICEEPRV